VTLNKGAQVDGLDEAPVDVRVATGVAKGVLAVPVSALLARAEGGYALELPDGTLVPVETGSYADGWVEVEGDGIAAGTKVVTAA
jgi:multidrug efflux pump subunit AcrA (membrane-fusion protein)